MLPRLSEIREIRLRFARLLTNVSEPNEQYVIAEPRNHKRVAVPKRRIPPLTQLRDEHRRREQGSITDTLTARGRREELDISIL